MKRRRPAKQTLISIGLTSVMLGLMTATHAISGSTVSLAATIQDQPAFVAATWKVFDLNNHQNLVASLNGHSGTLNMQPGYYLARLDYTNQHKETAFRVERGKNLHIQLALD